MSVSSDSASQEARTAGFKAALASTASRTLALYFSRPIRLFRPSKISGWHALRGQSLPLLIKQKGWIVIPRHFVPPLIVNAFLGTVLWTTYSEASTLLGRQFPGVLSPTIVAAISGGCAGSVQALAAAPAENVRIVLEGGRFRGSWSVAWKEVFAGAESLERDGGRARRRDEVRQVRYWVREVREMAGRGWQGLGFGVAKDSCAFAVFFALFDISRRSAARARSLAEHLSSTSTHLSPRIKARLPGIVHSTSIVTGGLLAGLSYEFVCRPFDVARRSIISISAAAIEDRDYRHRHKHRFHSTTINILMNKLKTEGLWSFFRPPPLLSSSSSSQQSSPGPNPRPAHTYTYTWWLRMLGRVGPWGVAFLAWENFGPGVVGVT